MRIFFFYEFFLRCVFFMAKNSMGHILGIFDPIARYEMRKKCMDWMFWELFWTLLMTLTLDFPAQI